jgi:hypothetical protein
MMEALQSTVAKGIAKDRRLENKSSIRYARMLAIQVALTTLLLALAADQMINFLRKATSVIKRLPVASLLSFTKLLQSLP